VVVFNFIFGMLADTDKAGRLAQIAVVMQYCSASSEAKQLHLNGKLGARLQMVSAVSLQKNLIILKT